MIGQRMSLLTTRAEARPEIYRVQVVQHHKANKTGGVLRIPNLALHTTDPLTLEAAFYRRVFETQRIEAFDLAWYHSAHILTSTGRRF